MDDHRFPVMGTTAQVMVHGGPTQLAERAQHRLETLEQRWSRFIETSEISAIGANAGRPTVVSPETFDLVARAIDGWRKTGGRFDPTVGCIMEAAGYDRPFSQIDPVSRFGTGEYRPAPTPQRVVLDPTCRAITVPVGLRLDLGGIAKGAAADLVAAELLGSGAIGCCVNIGGDLRAVGQPPRTEGWTIALPPVDGHPEVRLVLLSGAVCTSTTRKRRWTSPAGPEHHLRDPFTGAPAGGLQTVSIIGATATQSEVLAKAAMVAGPVLGRRIVSDAGATGRFIDDGGAVTELPGFQSFVADSSTPVAG